MGLRYSWAERGGPWTLLACHPHGGRGGGWATEFSTVPGIACGDLLNLGLHVWACVTAGGERGDPWTLLACHPHGGARRRVGNIIEYRSWNFAR